MRIAALAFGTIVLVFAGSSANGGMGATPSMAAPKAENASTHAKPRPVKLRLKDSPYGPVLFANGYAQYVFTRDKGDRSRCYGRCAEAWPPLRAPRRVRVGAGLDRDLVGTTRRKGGARQLTYAGQPLYGYEHDPRGEVLCHDVREFGGNWLAILGSGEPAPS